jgi:hypothetical protein
MYWDVVTIKVIAPRTLHIVFADGLEGSIFIDESFCTGVFTVLKDDAEINLAFVENGVVTWANGLDLAPDTMYKEIKTNFNRHYVITGKKY